MPLFVGVITVFMLLANSWHVLTEWMTNKPGEFFTGIAHYSADYFLYISQMVQGANGAWIYAHHQFTNETFAPTWIYWFNVLLGKLTIVGVNAFFIYNASIIVLGCILCYLLWIIAERRILPFLFLTTASGFLGVPDFWFSPTPALNRLGGVPHQIFQTILLLLVILLFSSGISTSTYVLLAICSFVAATANPIQMLILCIAVICTNFHKRSLRCIYILLPALLGAYMTNAEFAHQPILAAAKTWENTQHISVNLFQFWLALGPIGLLAPFGIIPFIKNLSPMRRVIGIYSIVSLAIFLSPIPKLLGTTSIRWLSPASYILFPILAAEGLHLLSKKKIVYIAGIFLYILCTIPSLITQIHSRTSPHSLNHVPKTIVEGIMSLRGTPDGVVLTDSALPYDILVPVLSGKPSFTGHPIHTLYTQSKEYLRQKFFTDKMNDDEMRKFFADHRIKYVIARRVLTNPMMLLRYENTALKIYTVTL